MWIETRVSFKQRALSSVQGSLTQMFGYYMLSLRDFSPIQIQPQTNTKAEVEPTFFLNELWLVVEDSHIICSTMVPESLLSSQLSNTVPKFLKET